MRIGLGLGLTNRYKPGTAAVPDVTAPVLSAPVDTKTGDTTATVGATTNESGGILYYYLSASSSPPTAANLKTGSGSLAFGNAVVTATGVRTISVTGLTASTSYYAHLLHRDGSGNDSNIVSGDGFTTDASSSTVNISTAPTISGDPIVGQRLFATNGTYSQTPDSYAGQWYKDAAAISGETADNYLIVDGDVGSVIAYKEIASKSGYTSSSLNASSNTAAVADISLTSAITAFTRTSSSGVTPMTFSVTFGSNVYSGYYLKAQVYSDSALTALTQEVDHMLTAGDMAGGAIDFASDGLTAIGATDWLVLTVFTTSPNGVYYSYTFPTPLTPTDATAALTWNSGDKEADILVINGNLTIVAEAAPTNAARATRGFSTGKKYVEFISNVTVAALYNGSASLSTDYSSNSANAVQLTGYNNEARYNGATIATSGPSLSALFTGSISGTVLTVTLVNVNALAVGDYIGGPGIPAGTKINSFGTGSGNTGTYNLNNSATLASTTYLVAGKVIGMAVDKTADKIYFSINGVWQNSADPAAGTGGLSISGIGAPVYFAGIAQSGYATVMYPGTTPGGTAGFAFTPPAGFVAL